MPSFFDRLGKVAQQTAAAAQQAANEGRINLEIRSIEGRLNEKAKDLGLMMFRRDAGDDISDESMLAAIQEMKLIEAEKKAKEAELADLHKPDEPAAPAPAAAPVKESAPEEPAAPAGVVCACGAINAAGAKFCTNCGQLLQ